MTKTRWMTPAAALLAVAMGPVAAQEATEDPAPLEVRVWLDRGDDAVLARGDRVRIYYRTSEDAHVSIFHIDTDGVVRLLAPRSPEEEPFVRAGTDYRLLFPRSPYWYVDEDEGQGYFFAVASPYPLDFGSLRYAAAERAWDLSAVGRTVYTDPYVAMDEYVAALIPDWDVVPYALDFISYDVGATHDYPRFLCYDCHGFRSYATWNPYTYACSSFRVVIWDDPYFYPAYRYGPTRVVFATPPRGRARFSFKERTAGEAWSPVTRTRQPPRVGVEYKEPAGAARERPVVAPTRALPVTSGARARPAPARTTPSADTPASGTGTEASRRPTTAAGATAPGRTATPREAPSARAREPERRTLAVPSATGDRRERPVLQRRPSAQLRPPSRDATPARVLPRPPSASAGGTPTRATPETRPGGTRVVVPRQPSARATPARPPSRPTPSVRSGTGSRAPTVNRAPPPQRRPVVRAKPPTRKKRGGGI